MDHCSQETFAAFPIHHRRAPWRNCSETGPNTFCLCRRTATQYNSWWI